MTKHTIDHSVLEMALVGLELQRDRIQAAISDIRAELANPSSSRSKVSETPVQPKTSRKKRFSAAARKRMALAQKKRWQLLKAKKKALAKKAKPTAKAKAKKTVVVPAKKKAPIQATTAKKVARRVVKSNPEAAKYKGAKKAPLHAVSRAKPKKADPKTKKIAASPNNAIEAAPSRVQPSSETAPTTA